MFDAVLSLVSSLFTFSRFVSLVLCLSFCVSFIAMYCSFHNKIPRAVPDEVSSSAIVVKQLIHKQLIHAIKL
jgi:hypothetical protein